MANCAKCGREEDSFVSIIQGKDDKGHAKFQDYNCFSCAMEEFKKRLRGVPFTIEVPDYPEYTDEELLGHGASINYIPELIDYPPHKGEAVEPKEEVVEAKETKQPGTKLAGLAQNLVSGVGEDYRLAFEELKDWVKKISDQQFKEEVAEVSDSKAFGEILSCGLPYNKQMILLKIMREQLVMLEAQVWELKRKVG